MRGMARFVAALALVVGMAGWAIAADNPLVGTWLHTDPGVPGQSPASAVYLSFAPDGGYEMRMDVAGGAPGQASGSNIVRGQYEMTGPDSMVYWERENYMCTGGACNPSPPLNPDFGQRKQSSFQMISPMQMQSAGVTWNRVQ